MPEMPDHDTATTGANSLPHPQTLLLPEEKKKKKNEKNKDSTSSKTNKVLLGKFELVGLLGYGSFAKVYEARDASTGQAVAIKCMSKRNLQERGLSKSVEREVAALRRLRHPNVVRIHELLACRRRAYIVMELARGGELLSRIARDGPLPESKAQVLFRQLVSAVGYCHQRGVFHRDLKPENLLLHLPEDDGDSGEPCLKITDFGLSAVAASADGDAGDAERQLLLRTQCGTPAYVAPEILAKKGRLYDGAKSDVWSCGIILYAMTAGYLPFNDRSLTTMCRKICRGSFSHPPSTSRGLRRLLSRLLDTNPATRITIDEIFDDPWFEAGVRTEERAYLWRLTQSGDSEDEFDICSGRRRTGAKDHELNAFDIISFSSGLDLSGMFGLAYCAATERLVVARPVGEVAATVEQTAKEAGLEVEWREGEGAGLVVRKGLGTVVATVEVLRLVSGSDMVVVEVGSGPDGAYQRSPYKLFWVEKLGPALTGLSAHRD